MAIGQSNMFSAPGDTQLGGNQQLAGASQPTAPSMGIFDTTAPVGQTMNQMQQSQLSPTISNPITGQTIDQMGQPQPQAQAFGLGLGLGGFNQFPPFGGFRPPIQQPIQQPIGNFPPPFVGFQPPVSPTPDEIPPNPIGNFPPGFRPTPPMMPPGGIGGFPPSFRPPGFRPPIFGRPPIGGPPIFGRPPIGRPPIGRPPQPLLPYQPIGRPPIFGRPPIGIGRPPIGIGGLGRLPPALIEAITGGRPIGIGAQPPNLGGIAGLGRGPAIFGGSNLFNQLSATPMSGGTPMPSLTDEVG